MKQCQSVTNTCNVDSGKRTPMVIPTEKEYSTPEEIDICMMQELVLINAGYQQILMVKQHDCMESPEFKSVAQSSKQGLEQCCLIRFLAAIRDQPQIQ